MNTTKQKPDFCIVTSPRPKASITPLSNIVSIFEQLSNQVYLVTGNEGEKVLATNKRVQGVSINYIPKNHTLLKIISYIKLQLRISYEILKISRKVNTFIFFMGEGLFLPVFMLKLFNKNVILNLAASAPQMIDSNQNTLFVLKIPKYLERFNYLICNQIIIYSPLLITKWELEKYREKISIANEHYLDFNKFKLQTIISQRENLIGYIGRFSDEKGTMNFVQSIPMILVQNPNINFLLAGSGPLEKDVLSYLQSNNLLSKTEFAGWISHDELPNYLNRLKLLVIPSYTEGLPNIMLEAMACGTPVLTTPVGIIEDYIVHEETGFILENNSPECISSRIINLLDYPDLVRISENSKTLVEERFVYSKAVEKYESVLEDLL